MPLFNYECDEVKRIIEEVSPNYPQLTTYEKEWIYFYKYGYIPGIPVELEYQEVRVNPMGTVQNAIPYSYKRAILKGNTLVNVATKYHGGSDKIAEVLMTPTLLKANTKYYIKVIDNEFNLKRVSFRTKDWKDRWSYATNGVAILTTPSQDEVNDLKYLVFNVIKNGETVEIDNTIRDRLKWIICEYQEGMENWDIPYFEGMKSVQMPVLTTSNGDGTKTNILTVNEDVSLRSNGNVYDELDLLTGKLTQRIGEDGVVLSQEVVKTVDLTPLTSPYEGTNHYHLTTNIPCEAILEVPVVSTGEQTLQEINND